MTKHYRIAVLPGDGIGPEITEAALAVVNAATHNVPGVRRDNIRGTDPVCVCWTPFRGGGTTTGGNLPATGSELDGLLLAAGAFVAAGGLLLIGARRRRTSVR